MTHVTCRLTAKKRDQLRDPTLGNRVWATFTFFNFRMHHFVVKFSLKKFFCLRRQRGINPTNQNPADAVAGAAAESIKSHRHARRPKSRQYNIHCVPIKTSTFLFSLRIFQSGINQLRNPMLGNRVWSTCTFFLKSACFGGSGG